MKTLILIIASFTSLLALFGGGYLYTQRHKRKKQSIPLSSDYARTGMILLRTTINNKRCVFLLDTGAEISSLEESKAKELGLTLQKSESNICGIGGETNTTLITQAEVKYQHKTFPVDFYIINMVEVFRKIKASTGVTVHGILGMDFIYESGLILDFNKKTLYFK